MTSMCMESGWGTFPQTSALLWIPGRGNGGSRVPVQIRHRVVQMDGDLEQNLDGLTRILLPEASGSQHGTS